MSNLEAVLQERGAILRGHFQFARGRHGDTYIEKFRILQWPDITGQMCALIADHFRGVPNLVAARKPGESFSPTKPRVTPALPASSPNREETGPGGGFLGGSETGPGHGSSSAEQL